MELKRELDKNLYIQKALPVFFVFMWASGAIFVSIGLTYATPFVFVFLRLLISSLLLWLLFFIFKLKLPKSREEWKVIIITGLLMQAGYQIFYFLALFDSISPGVLTIILGAQPIITTFFVKQRNSVYQWWGLLLGIMGLFLVVGDSIFDSKFTLTGMAYAILCLLAITFGTLLQSKVATNQITNMSIQYTLSTLFITVVLFFTKNQVEWTNSFIFSLLWMVLVVSVGATLLLYTMINKGNVVNVTSLFYCVPPLTVIFDLLIFGNSINLITIIGMLIIIFGLILVNKKKTAISTS